MSPDRILSILIGLLIGLFVAGLSLGATIGINAVILLLVIFVLFLIFTLYRQSDGGYILGGGLVGFALAVFVPALSPASLGGASPFGMVLALLYLIIGQFALGRWLKRDNT